MNWDDPAERGRLIDRVGPKEYNRLLEEHLKAITVETVNGYPIIPVNSRFGRLYQVSGTSSAFKTLEAARAFALQQPKKPE